MNGRAIIGVDLGQCTDHSAVVVGYPRRDTMRVRFIEQLQLGMKYELQSRRIAEIYQSAEKDSGKRPFLIVDGTGVGRAVVELMRQENLHPDAIVTVTGGNNTTKTGPEWHVPKKELVYPLITGIQNGTVTFIKELPYKDTLIHELETFRLKVKISTGNETFEAWREGDHDDLVFACALCVYAWSTRVESGAYAIQQIPSKYNEMHQSQDPFMRHRAKYR